MKVNFEVDFDNVQEIDSAISLLERAKDLFSKPGKKIKEMPVKAETVEAVEEAEEEATQDAPDTSSDDKGMSIQDLRELVSKKAKTHRDDIKKKLKELGAENISSLDKSLYDEMYDFLSDL